MNVRRSAAATAAVALGVLALSACSGSTSLPSAITADVPDTTTAAAPGIEPCTDAERAAIDEVATYPALDELPTPGAMPAESTMRAIQDRGQLRVGVSGDVLLFGARNPISGELEGVDIDMVKEVARAIFGGDIQDRIEYHVITYADRIPVLRSGEVDLVAHTMTINCARWKQIAFSSVYFRAGQKVLVQKGSAYDLPNGNDAVEALDAAGATVCAPNGSTNIDQIRAFEGIDVLAVDDISDCLVAMQQGRAAATTGDDTVLAGFAAQDPTTVVAGEPFSDEPYGLGMSRDLGAVDFVQFVNAVLADRIASGRYDEIISTWLSEALPKITPIPAPDFSRPLP